jgi:hypothetical protein
MEAIMNLLRSYILFFSIASSICVDQRAEAFDQFRLGNYSFELVASTNADVNYLSSPKLTDSGAIAYQTSHADRSSAIYFSDGGQPKKVIASDHVYGEGRIERINLNIDINNHGVIAFATNYIGTLDSTVFGVFTLTPAGVLTKVSQNDPSVYFHSSGVSINDSGEVVYLGSATSHEDVYANTSTVNGMIFHGSDYNRGPSSPEINNDGLVAFAGNTSSVGATEEMFTYMNGQVTKIDSTPAPVIVNHMGPPGLNDNGEIAYVRQMSDNQFDLVLFKDGHPTVLPVVGAIDTLVQINNAEEITFYGRNPDGSYGVRTYLNGDTHDVLGFGDNIFGRKCTYVLAWDINERGQMALTVDFTDGSSAVLIATPVPEPPGFSLILIGMALAACRKMRCRNAVGFGGPSNR